MVKPIMKKIISGIITVAIIFTCVSSPSYASAAINTPKLNWDNPNKSGTNPFKFKLQDSLNSNMVMSVIGCTGIVNKISAAVTGFIQKKIPNSARYCW